jgi:hypothetical protein
MEVVGFFEVLSAIVGKSLESTPKMPLHVVTLNPMSSKLVA